MQTREYYHLEDWYELLSINNGPLVLPPVVPTQVTMVPERWLPYQCFEEAVGGDAVTMALHRWLPLAVQERLRDRHMRNVFDVGATLLGIGMGISNPTAVREFLALGRVAKFVTYGDTKHHLLEVHKSGYERAPVLVFVHGGAWCSGAPWMYRLICNAALRLGFDVVLLGYTVYLGESAEGDVEHQIRDIKRGLIYLQSHPEILDLTGRSIFLSGHSSGAHITSLLLLREAQRPRRGLEEQIPPIAAFIGFSGVYDVGAHYEYEAWRGVHEISGMKPANKGVRSFQRYSPTYVAARLTPEQARRFPPSLIMHGTADTTVPYTNSLGFAEALQSAGATCHTAWLPDIDHFDTVGTLFFEPDSASERQVGKFKKMIVAANDPRPRARL